MSGPKVLSAEEIRMMEEERERQRIEQAKREERMRLVQEQFRKCDILKRQISIANEMQAALVSIMDNPEAAEISARLHTITLANQQAIESWSALEQSEDNDVLRNHVNGLDAVIMSTEGVLNSVKYPIESMRSAHIEKMMSRVVTKDDTNVKKAENTKRPDIPEEALENEARRILAQIKILKPRVEEAGLDMEMLNTIEQQVHDSLSDDKRERWMIFEEIHRIDVFRLRPFVSTLERQEAENDALEAELSEALAKYHSLCSMYHIEPKQFPFKRESVTEIRYACGDLIEQFSQAVDCEAIMKRVRATLTEMGYRYIGQKEESRRYYRQIYRIHGDTILHAVFDSTGRVTMEVAIESDSDRQPNAREISSIVREQETFCNSFERIFDSLDEHGLVMRKDMMCPCGAEYAQIINTSGFTKEQGKDEFDYSIYSSRKRKYLRG